MKKMLSFFIFFISAQYAFTQNDNALLQRVKDKLLTVNNYQASALMKTNIPFLRVPQSVVTVYFAMPDKLKIKNDKGISFVPKGAASISMSSIISENNFTVINAGNAVLNGIKTIVLKLLPADNSNIILSTIYIDEKNAVIIKAITTSKNNGTYELNLRYGKYINYGLPDDVIFIFNTRDYKIPKGVTFDYDDAPAANNNAADKDKNQQGSIELQYTSYKINKGVSDAIFK